MARATGEGAAAVGGEGHTENRMMDRVHELLQLLPAFHFPSAHRLVLAAGKGEPAVGREGDAVDGSQVPVEPADLLAFGLLPSGGDVYPELLPRLAFLPRLGVPHLHRSVLAP